MTPVRLFAAAASLALLSACAPSLGPPPPGYVPPPAPGEPAFMASEFAWSQMAGTGSIVGRLVYAEGETHYSCQGTSVILTPETPWSRRRMQVLYENPDRAALPTDQVRANMAKAPPGDSTPFIKRAACDATDRFSFAHLPAGAWYVLAIAKPSHGSGPSLAVMRRVVTHAGKPTNLAL